MNIYTVTVFKHYEDDESRLEGRSSKNRQRTWGWYSTFEEAEKSILGNWTDMFEDGYYDLALVEEVPEGVCTYANAVQWYKAVYAPQPAPHFRVEPSVSRVEQPDWAKNGCNWSMS